MIRRHHSRRGFTLIELLTVIAVTTILTGIVLSLNAGSRYQLTLLVEGSKLAQIIAKAKSYAIATYNQTPAPCGYGVHIDQTASPHRYVLFSYAKTDCTDIPFIDTASAGYRELSITTLPPGVIFSASGSSSTDPVGDIFFVPPAPTTLLWAGDPPTEVETGAIVLSSTDGTAQREVMVSTAGQITF